MPDPIDALILDLLEWIGPKTRPYREVLDAWRTSCPRLPVWEGVNERGLVTRARVNGVAVVCITEHGRAFLRAKRSSAQAVEP